MEVALRHSLLPYRTWLLPSKIVASSLMASSKPWNTDPISLEKKKLRKEIADLVAQVTPTDIENQSAVVTAKVLSSLWFKNAKRISIYTHAPGEIQTDKIVEESLKQGKEVFLPQFQRGNIHMRMLKLPSYDAFAGMKPYLWGIRQPSLDDHWEPYEDSGPLDLILMPGVAFTKNGARLGHGMGYYDRMLNDHQKRFGQMPNRYALALVQQMVDNVPLCNTDVPLDGVIRAD